MSSLLRNNQLSFQHLEKAVKYTARGSNTLVICKRKRNGEAQRQLPRLLRRPARLHLLSPSHIPVALLLEKLCWGCSRLQAPERVTASLFGRLFEHSFWTTCIPHSTLSSLIFFLLPFNSIFQKLEGLSPFLFSTIGFFSAIENR